MPGGAKSERAFFLRETMKLWPEESDGTADWAASGLRGVTSSRVLRHCRWLTDSPANRHPISVLSIRTPHLRHMVRPSHLETTPAR